MPETEKKTDKYDLMYQENAKIVAIFWEWRHKEMTFFFAGIAPPRALRVALSAS